MRDSLLEALPRIARFVGGHALLADASGRILRAVDPRGDPCPDYENTVLGGFDSPETAPRQTTLPATSAPLQVIPLDNHYLCIAQSTAVIGKLREVFQEALPLIARVAGGEAVLFDNRGTRLLSVDSSGKTNSAYVGQVSNLALQSMREGKPLMGDSTYIVGARAVRIPVCNDFGIGFNNNDSVTQRQKLIDSIYRLNKASAEFSDFVGKSPDLEEMKREAREAALLDCATLLVGGRGTGKRMLAEAIHNGGPRRQQNFVTVNCDALEQDLLEGAIFGYADAVIRGVRRGRHDGAIVLAAGGTLYLANIDKMGLDVQIRLHQAIVSGRFRPVGDNEFVTMNVRILASAPNNLEPTVRVGLFDEELQQRLSERVITLPPLSAMPEIIPDLAMHFIRQLNQQYGTQVEKLDGEVADILTKQTWRGNAGELRAFLQTLLSGFGQETIVEKHNLPMGLLTQTTAAIEDPGEQCVFDRLIEEYEARVIRHALEVNGGSRAKTAEQLGLSKSSLWRKMKRFYIE